ncbi:AAA family ATPase, partial [Desulfovibrio sp.]
MPKILPLPTSRLHATFDPERIPWQDSREIPLPRNGAGSRNAFQPRAMQALDMALNIRACGYNVYVSGDANLGRSYTLLSYLGPQARKRPTPPDLVYVHNFDDPDRPRLLSLPAGQGKKFKQCVTSTVDAILHELPRRFEAAPFVKQRARLVDSFQKVRSGLLSKMTSVAQHKGFHLDMDEGGSLTLYPLVKGKRLSEEEFEHLDDSLRMTLKRRGETLVQSMASFMRQLSKAEESFHDDERNLEQTVMAQVLDALLLPAQKKLLKACQSEALEQYFVSLRADILKNTEAFLPREAGQSGPDVPHAPLPPQGDPLYRYDVNVFVDNSQLSGAPIVVEDHPTASNLLGCIERESELGALVTDFTLVRAGSLHKANGGFLVLRAEDLLQHPNAWEGLLRALRANSLRIEDGAET